MFLTKRHLSRRAVLKGAGVTLALPLLDAMVPAATPLAQTAASPKLRMGFFYIPHGAILGNTSHGAEMDKWTPRGALTIVVMARAMADAWRKWPCLARPHFTHSLRTKAPSSAPQSEPISLQVGPGRTIDARTPVSSSSICNALAIPSKPHLLAL